MAISLIDIGNFASGAIKRDRELTEKKLKNRQEELASNRDLIIAINKDKYAQQIKNYNDEKIKSDEIKKLNVLAEKGAIDKDSYAKQYLLNSLGVEKFNALQKVDPEGFLDMVSNINTTRDYKLVDNRADIDNRFLADTALVNKTFADKIEEAQGDSFLINKLLRRKSTVNEDINSSIDEQMKAAKIVKEETPDGVESYAGIPLEQGVRKLRKPTPEYETEFSTLQKAASFDSLNNKDNLINFVGASNNLGFTTQLNFEFDEKKGEIKGMNSASISFLNTYKSAYDSILKSNNATALYNGVTKQKSDLVNIINSEEINKQVQNILLTRQSKIETGRGAWESNKDLITIVPLNVVNINNQTKINGKVFDIDIGKASQVYQEFLKTKVKQLYKDSNLPENQQFSNIQQLIENKQPSLVNELKTLLSKEASMEESQTSIPVEKTTPSKEDVNQKVKFVLLPTGDAFSDGNKKYTFDIIKKNNEADKLPKEIKAAYDIWEAKTNTTKPQAKQTTYQDMQKQVSKNNQKIIGAFSNFKDNMGNIQSNNQYGNQNPIKSN